MSTKKSSQEKQRYLAIKLQIRKRTKKLVNAITQEQREKILQQGRQEGKQAFLKQIENSSDIQPVNATYCKYEHHHLIFKI